MREGDYLRWRLDPVAFAEDIGMRSDPWQVEMLRSRRERMLLNCSRQSGKFSSVAVLALWRALCFPNSLVLCLSPSLRQSSELFNKVATYYADLGKPISTKEEQKLSIRFENRSRVVALPSNEATVRGFSKVDLCLIDEAARVPARLYHSVTPMLATSKRSRMILLSTPAGQEGNFFAAWTRGGRRWERYQGTADMVPRISEEFLAFERAELPKSVYEQEYECKFVAPANSYFVPEHVDQLLEPLGKNMELLDLGGGLKV